jgi:TolA-binding protein
MIRSFPPRRSAGFAWLVFALMAAPALRADPEPPAAEADQPPPPATPTTAPVPAEPAATKVVETPAEEAADKPAPPKANTDALPGAEIASMLKLGASLTDREDYEAATIAYHQVLRGRGVRDEDLKTALLGLARMHRRQGALTKAAALYETFLKQYPEDARTPDALLDLGRTLRGLGTYGLAITRFYSVINSTLKISGGDFDRYQLLAKTAQFEIAETHFQSGNFPDAVKFFTRLRLLDLAPADHARAQFKSAYAQHLQGLNEPAVTSLRAFLDQWPKDENAPEAQYLLAVSLRQLGRTQEAFTVTLDLLRTAQSGNAIDAKRWAYWQRRTGNQLANDFFATGNILNAHAIYAGLAELSPDPVWRLPILYQVALCLERLGHAERAAETYRTIVESGKAAATPEFNELNRMANWRLEQLAWQDKTNQEIAALFETNTGRLPVKDLPAPAKTADVTDPKSPPIP